MLLTFCLNLPAQSVDNGLLNLRIDDDDVRTYNSLADMIRAEDLSCLQEVNTFEDFAFAGNLFALQNPVRQWTVFIQPSDFNVNTSCDAEFLSAKRLDLNQDGRPEFILRFRLNIHGYSNLQGVVEDYVQIWDTFNKKLILSRLEHTAEFDFSAGEQGPNSCFSTVTCSPGTIAIAGTRCIGHADGLIQVFRMEQSDSSEDRTYFCVDGAFVLQE